MRLFQVEGATLRKAKGIRLFRHYVVMAASMAAVATSGAYVYATPTGIGMTGLPAGLNGSGINVAQVEANLEKSTTTDAFEANAANGNIANGNIAMTYIDFNGIQSSTVDTMYSSGTYSDIESSHADIVGGNFYGKTKGVAPGVAHVDNYDAGYFQNSVIGSAHYVNGHLKQYATANNDKIINQSFVNLIPSTDNSAQTLASQNLYDAEYDNYTNTYNTIFVSAVGDGTGYIEGGTTSQINPPATAYNSISVGAYPYTTSATGIGPTLDGRVAPDIVAPASYTSYSTPLVSGAAAIMVQAGTLGDGYVNGDSFANQTVYTAAATDDRTVKALLINGAVKPAGWTNSYSINSGTYTYNSVAIATITPLDPRYGSGLLNVDNSYNNLAAGRVTASTVNSSQTALTTPTINQNEGWDFSSIARGTSNVIHYVFNLSNANQAYNLTSTLVWNAQTQMTVVSDSLSFAESLNNIDLNLYNAAGEEVASSDSSLDNLQQLYLLGLDPGIYDLQVVDMGGHGFSATDQYALAYNFQAVPEPLAVWLMLSGVAALLLMKRRVSL